MSKAITVFRITCNVLSANLATVIGALEDAAQIVEVRALEEPAPAKPPKFRYVNGKKNKGISGRDLLLEILSKYKRPVSRDALSREFVSRGFAANSLSPTISALVHEGEVDRAKNGYVSLRPGK